MALRRFCDKCGTEIFGGRHLVIEIKSGSGRRGLRGELGETDLCEDCAEKVCELVTGWEEITDE